MPNDKITKLHICHPSPTRCICQFFCICIYQLYFYLYLSVVLYLYLSVVFVFVFISYICICICQLFCICISQLCLFKNTFVSCVETNMKDTMGKSSEWGKSCNLSKPNQSNCDSGIPVVVVVMVM